jgi:hypothetical protein
VTANELRPGRRLQSESAQAALRLLDAFRRSPLADLVEIASIDLSSPEALKTSLKQGGEITFGLNNIERQLQRWYSIYEHGLRLGKSVATLDLSVANNLPMTWAEPPEVSVDEKPLNPVGMGKKDV